MHAARSELATRQPAERTPPLVFGMVLFIASETMFFASFFAAYFLLRNVNATWPPAGVRLDLQGPTISTLVLAATSPTIYLARVALRRDSVAGFRAWVLATFACGAAFLALEMSDWARLTFGIDSNAYGSVFYGLTGFHALHMFVGLVLLVVLLVRAALTGYEYRDHAGSEAVAYYWHFLLVMWLAICAAIYFAR